MPVLPFVVVPGREISGPGEWDRIFGRNAPLVVEIGFGKDPFLLDRAAARPAEDHVGVERDPGRVAAFVAEIGRRGLGNVRALPVAAELALAVCFEDRAVAELHVYFPDPWPKLRHAKNRLVQPWFAREARRVLRPEGRLLLATDDAPYAAQMREVLASAFTESDGTEKTTSTKFERLWRARGRAIHRMEFVPRAGSLVR